MFGFAEVVTFKLMQKLLYVLFSEEYDDDEEDKISVTSEPAHQFSAMKKRHFNRPGSEGATPGSTTSDEVTKSLTCRQIQISL